MSDNNNQALKAEILAVSAATCNERFVRLTMRLNPNSFEVTDVLIPLNQAKERLKDLFDVVERLSHGEENERLYTEAVKIIESADLSLPDVVATTIEAVSEFGQWGCTAMYSCLFGDDANTRLLAMRCVIADHDNYREYLPFLHELHEHDDEAVRRLVPELLKRFESSS